MTLLAPTLETFFTERLMTQRRASPHTIAGYRDTMRLLLTFASQQTSKPPSKVDVADLDARLISAFLDHLEQERGNSATTRGYLHGDLRLKQRAIDRTAPPNTRPGRYRATDTLLAFLDSL